MASWLKVAEDLLEVVDRRAKLVVSEFSEDQSGSQTPAPNGTEVQARRPRSKDKGQNRVLRSSEIPKSVVFEPEESARVSVPPSGGDESAMPLPGNHLDTGGDNAAEASDEIPPDKDKGAADMEIVSMGGPTDNGKGVGEPSGVVEIAVTENSMKSVIEDANDGVVISNSIERAEKELEAKGLEAINSDLLPGDPPKTSFVDDRSSSMANIERNEPGIVEVQASSGSQSTDRNLLESSITKKQQDKRRDASPMKFQDQLDEAQRLLNSANSTGQSKEARLARVCAGLSSRLQEYKSENAQLEELLVGERELCSSYETHIKQLQQELSLSKNEVARGESNFSDALAAKNSEIEVLRSTLDVIKKQSSASEDKLSSLQENMEEIMRNRELAETRMMQALREELACAERRAEEERAAHNATKMAAVEREVELEHRAVEASNALARMQRSADESQSRTVELEHKMALVEVECSTLNQQLQEMETRTRRGQKKASEEANQALQMQAWQEEVERARQGQRDSENKLSSLEADLQKMRVEMAVMKRDAEHYSRHEHIELEKRYRELTDLLYHKQTQLEAMASEKSAAEFQLEKETKRFQEAQVEMERIRNFRRASSVWEEDVDLKTLDPLPLHHRHIAGASRQLQRAAKFIDTGAVRATRFLWRYPTARVILVFYLVFVHLFLMYLLHHLQEQADKQATKEVEDAAAAFVGLSNSSLP